MEILGTLRRIGSPPREIWEESCDTVEALGRHIEDHFYAPALATLRRQGDLEPEAREIVGEWPVFWGGNRVHTLGRIIAEWDVSRRWSRKRRAEGDWDAARGILWPCEPGSVERCAIGLRDALADQAIDIAAETDGFLNGDTLTALNAAAEAAEARRKGWPVSRDEARDALALARRAHGLLTELAEGL